jgi:hypothetical protein
VQAWESIRTAYCYVQTVPTVDASVYVLYIEPLQVGQVEGDRRVAILDLLTIPAGDHNSYDPADRPDGRRMPYGTSWPPNRLEVVTTLATINSGWVGTGVFMVIEPEGEFDLWVTVPGGAADLIAVVQS